MESIVAQAPQTSQKPKPRFINQRIMHETSAVLYELKGIMRQTTNPKITREQIIHMALVELRKAQRVEQDKLEENLITF